MIAKNKSEYSNVTGAYSIVKIHNKYLISYNR